MRAQVVPKFADRGVDVYLFERHGPGQHLAYTLQDGMWKGEPVGEAEWPATPSLSMPMEMLEAIVRASEGHVHAQDATVRHLDDTVATRDRLLAMIEQRGLR